MADSTGFMARAMAALRFAATGQIASTWFGPGIPLADTAPPEVKGRSFDYPLFINVNYLPRHSEQVSFAMMKNLAANCEPLKMLMRRQRNLVCAVEWAIKPRVESKGAPEDADIKKITDFLAMPDREHDWPQWLNGVLDQNFVYDAVSIYSRQTKGGELYALEAIDGSTITPLVDAGGRRPVLPDAAFKQVLKGMPAVSYTTDELLYYPENYRVDHVYGCSRVEDIITTVESSIARLKSQLGYYTHGNVGDGYFTAPPDATPDQVTKIEKSWNVMMSADGGQRLADRRQAPFLPNGTEWHPTKVDIMQAEFDEWLIRLICFEFGVAPTPFLKQMGLGHGSAQTDKESATEGGTAPIMEYVRNLMNRLLATRFNRPDLEFAWVEDKELDPKTRAEIEDKKLRNGSLTLDQVADMNGLPALPDGLGAKPLIYTASGATPLELVLNPPPPPPAPSMQPPPGEADDAAAPPATDDAEDKTGKPALEKAASSEDKLAAVITKFLATRGAVIAKQLGDALGLEKVDPIDDYSDRIERAFDAVDWDWSDLVPQVEPILASIAVAGATEKNATFGLFDKKTLAKLMEPVMDWAERRAAELVGMRLVDGELVENPDAEWSIPDATRNMLRSTVTEALENGDSTDQLAKAIRESAAFSDERAETIARTEMAIAHLSGARTSWRESGLVAGRQFIAAPDCCDECQDQNGVIVGIDEEFPAGDAPLHPNCRCDEAPVLPEDMPGANDGGDED